jgi:hypothetical protein
MSAGLQQGNLLAKIRTFLPLVQDLYCHRLRRGPHCFEHLLDTQCGFAGYV